MLAGTLHLFMRTNPCKIYNCCLLPALLSVRQHSSALCAMTAGRMQYIEPSLVGAPLHQTSVHSIDAAFNQLKGDFQKPLKLKRQGAGCKTFTIWRPELDTTAKKPLVLTKVAKRKVCNKLMQQVLWLPHGCMLNGFRQMQGM